MASSIRAFPIVGYRGAPQLVPPGNTLESFRKAIEVGATMLAADVRRTSDDVLVLFNDAVIKVEGHDVPILHRSQREWKANTNAIDGAMPMLSDLLALASNTGVGLMLALREPGAEAQFARAVRKSGLPLDSILVWGIDVTSRGILRGLDPRIPLAHTFDVSEASQITPKLLSEIDTTAVVWHHRLLNPAFVKILHLREVLVYGWGADISDDMRRLRDDCAVDGIVTSAPDLLRAIAVEAVRSARTSTGE